MRTATAFEAGDLVWVRARNTRRAALATVESHLLYPGGARGYRVRLVSAYYDWDDLKALVPCSEGAICDVEPYRLEAVEF